MTERNPYEEANRSDVEAHQVDDSCRARMAGDNKNAAAFFDASMGGSIVSSWPTTSCGSDDSGLVAASYRVRGGGVSEKRTVSSCPMLAPTMPPMMPLVSPKRIAPKIAQSPRVAWRQKPSTPWG
jgi:hypothetical protein